jgi:nitrate/TMAO reductase-like tetraheme cytochrome c subunit
MGARGRLIAGVAFYGTVCGALYGQSHAGQPVPKYVTGDECLFCHRVAVADTWEQNPHARTVHPREGGDWRADATFVLGAHPPQRGLKPDGYGRYDLLSRDGKTWDKQAFALRCAGCHTTAVDPRTHAFSTAALDCYACHGIAPENHPNDTSLVWFSKKHPKDPRQIVSICGQCHLREGKSKLNGLPYPNNFVAGDDLFADFDVNLTVDESLNPGDRHVVRNVREVLKDGSDVTCISCHRIHEVNTSRHRLAPPGPICLDCHNAEGPKKVARKYTVHSALCEY